MTAANLAIVKNETMDAVEQRIKALQRDGAIHFPANYSPQNALRSAWLILQETEDKNKNPVLQSCTRESIANALLSTVIQGLSPNKKQVYYIAYGDKLTAMRSYHGTMAVTLRMPGVEDVFAQVVYDGDEFEYRFERGAKKIAKHTQKLEDVDIAKIKAAYCTVIYDGGKEYSEIMTIAQIKKAWTKSQMSKNNTHTDFAEEMAKRTVINRTCKKFINSSCDNDLILEKFNEQPDAETDEEFAREVAAKANKKLIDPETGEVHEIVDEQGGAETKEAAAAEEQAGESSDPF